MKISTKKTGFKIPLMICYPSRTAEVATRQQESRKGKKNLLV
jgi:hypothetical protein